MQGHRLPTSTQYKLMAPLISHYWNDSNLLSSATTKDCGHPVLEIINADGTPINNQWFNDDNFGFSRAFTILEQGMLASLGTHRFKIRAYFSAAAFNYIDSTEFSVEIIDPCTVPIATIPTTTDQFYTINDPAQTYSMQPKFSVQPAMCHTKVWVRFSEHLTDYLKFDEQSQMFSLRAIKDSLKLSGPIERAFPISVVYSTYTCTGEAATNHQLDFKWIFRNPCIDADSLTVVTPLLTPDVLTYTLFDNRPIGAVLETSSLFVVEPSICMHGVEYFMTFNGAQVTTASSPIRLTKVDISGI